MSRYMQIYIYIIKIYLKIKTFYNNLRNGWSPRLHESRRLGVSPWSGSRRGHSRRSMCALACHSNTSHLIKPWPMSLTGQWFSPLFFRKKRNPESTERRTPPVRVPRKHHASRRRPRIRYRTAHARPSPYKTTPRTHPSQIPRLLASSRLWPEPPRHAVAAARLGEEREAAAAPIPRHPRLIPPGTDRYADPPRLIRFVRSVEPYPRFDLICGFWGICLGFDRWRRRGSWRSWRTCRRTRPPPAVQVISSLALWFVSRSCGIVLRLRCTRRPYVLDWCLLPRLVIDAVRALVTLLVACDVMFCVIILWTLVWLFYYAFFF